MNHSLRLTAAVVVLGGTTFGPPYRTASADGQPRPTAMILSPDGKSAWVAHRGPGSIVVVDLERGATQTWPSSFGDIHDLTVWNDQAALALADHPVALIGLDRRSQPPNEIGRWTGLDGATRVRVSGDGRRVAVASLVQGWVKLATSETMESTGQAAWHAVELPFSPGEIVWLPDQRHLLAADAFGSRLALIDAESQGLLSVRMIPGHNISGLALGPGGKRLYLTHQSIHRGAHTSLDDVHWGGILTNVLRSVSVADLIDPAGNLLDHTARFHLGDIGRGAGDPAGVTVRDDGLLVVTLAGVDELAFDAGAGIEWKRVHAGARPCSVALTPDGKNAVVLNELDDSLSVVSLSSSEEFPRTIRLSPEIPLTAADRGERLFFNARLSHDGWFSCHSCHTHGHTNGQLVDNLTDGTDGTPKRVLSLRGVRDTRPYAWDGHMLSLADQVRHSVTSTMQGEALEDREVSDLVAYLETLAPFPRRNESAAVVARGAALFERENCIRCHATPFYTTPETYDVGLSDERGRRRFNPPSLRGVSRAAPYFHDGRAETLEDVVGRLRHQLHQELTPEEQADLIAFLRSL